MTDVTAEWIAKTFESVKNWGRWGDDDQMGALHYITPARRARAAATVRDGVTVSCALDFPVVPSLENPIPAQHHMLVAGDALGSTGGDLETALDYIGISFHGMATSHIDAVSTTRSFASSKMRSAPQSPICWSGFENRRMKFHPIAFGSKLDFTAK